MKFLGFLALSLVIGMGVPAWAFKDFKQACQIPHATPVAQRNFAENIILLKTMDGSGQCWLASFTLKDGAIDKVTCQALESCIEWYKNH